MEEFKQGEEMKTETQIAKENIRELIKEKIYKMEHYCISHKASCQRFLEFMECLKTDSEFNYESCSYCNINDEDIKDKITDLKQAIKLYEDNGI